MKFKDLSKLSEQDAQSKQLKAMKLVVDATEGMDIAEKLALVQNLQAQLNREMLRLIDKHD